MTEFVSLNNRTHFSILNALPSPKDYFVRAKELNQKAIAITDCGSFAGIWDALKVSKETGVKLIVGCTFYFVDNVENRDTKLRFVVLIAKNEKGYKNILTLNRIGFDNSSLIAKKVLPIIDWKLLKEYSDGVICLTACGNGIIGQLLNNKKFDEAEAALIKLSEIFGDNLGVEVQTHNLNKGSTYYSDGVNQFFTNTHLIRLANKHNIKIVPTTNSHYLKREDAETHDVLLAIGSMQPVYSNNRIKYDISDLYLKSADEVKAFFARNNSEEFAEKICANTIYFADKCEFPDWVDPKYSNPTGKELPIFPVEKEIDYDNFKTWLSKRPEIKDLDIDKAYLRFKCGIEFNKKVPFGKEKEYRDRLIEELDVIEYHGFSSYMLMVADYINWAKQNGIRVGVGRGCLTGDTDVLTSNGFKKLDKITNDDYVYTHTGELKKVVNCFKFDISNEELLKIKTQYSFNDISLTNDHKIYGSKSILTDRFIKYKNKNYTNKIKKYIDPTTPTWIEANKLNKGDYIYTLFPNKNMKYSHSDLIKDFSIRYSSTHNSNLDRECIIKFDDEFIYWLGRFIGDGWIRLSDKYDSYNVSICFNSNDKIGIDRFCNYWRDFGFSINPLKHKTKDLVQINIYNKALALKFREFFPDYSDTSKSKHLPIMFRYFDYDKTKILLQGLIDSDGSIKDGNRISIDSTSERLIKEIKEVLLFMKIKSYISTRKSFYREQYLCNTSYKLRFSKNDWINPAENKGYFSKILDISKTKSEYVYDITVEDDHSYLTTNGVVHNSVGGSLIAYLLGIHQADPIKYKLIFARFHNKEKKNWPDIDSDFAPAGRDRVQDYIRQKYGIDHVAHVSNINTITPKVYARDISRACDLANDRAGSVKLGDEIADSIPKKIDEKEIKTFEEAVNKSPLFSEYISKYPKLAVYSSIYGKYRAWATHAGGIIISKRPLTGLFPLRKDKDGAIAVEFDKERAEENGLIKMDMLGLKTLDIIDETYKRIKLAGKPTPLDPPNFDEYDKETYDLIAKGDTFCVFQLGTSSGTIDLCKRMKSKSIEDISHINALARPSARDIRDGFISAREGKKKVQLIHPSLKRAFGDTFGFGLYEESLMYLAQDVAGWSLHEADRLRKLTKEKGKNPKKALQWRSEFISDAKKNNDIDEKIAMKIWDEVIDKFQGYGFNLSHSIMYSMISYHTAYLKAHYPIEFLLANLMAEVRSGAKIAKKNIEKIKQEIRSMGVKIVPPDINKSSMSYEVQPDGSLLTGLEALKSVEEGPIQDIINKRPFTSFNDFMLRTDSSKVRSPAIQSLASSGCLDSFGISKKLIFLYCSDYRKKLQIWLKKHDPKLEIFSYPWPDEKNWSLPELYALEKSYLGESFVCGKDKAYVGFFDNHSTPIKDIKQMHDKEIIPSIRAEVKSVFEFKVKKETSKFLGENMIKATIEDQFGEQITLTIFPNKWKEVRSRIRDICRNKYQFDEGIAIHFSGTVNVYEDEIGIVLENFFDLAPPPALPKDLKAKKVSIKRSSKSDVEIINTNINDADFINNIEDQLFDEGLIDLDQEYDN